MQISRDQALCLLFCVEYNQKNVEDLRKRMEDFKDLEVCYKDDPTNPLLLPLIRLNANAYTYKKYISDDVFRSLDVNEKEDLSLDTEAQIIHYLNEAYLSQYPFAGELYEFKQVLTTEIFANLIQYTSFFNKKTPHGFSNWCSKKDLKLLEVNTGRKRLRSGSSTGRYRSLYVLKKEHHQELVRSIVEHLPKYHDFLCKLKDEGYQIVGYARKSPTNENDEDRSRLLTQMVHLLRRRSLVDKIFVSSISHANEPMDKRDIIKHQIIKTMKDVAGDTQDLLKYIKDSTKICLVAIDYAGLSTNIADINNFIRDNSSVQKIIIDQYYQLGRFHVLERENILNNTSLLRAFQCRGKSIQRSKEC